MDAVPLSFEASNEQTLIDVLLDAVIYDTGERERLRRDPLVRFLIPNRSGQYNFTIVSAMGVITEGLTLMSFDCHFLSSFSYTSLPSTVSGKHGLELQDAFNRLKAERGVEVIRADTGTARSFEFNAAKIEDAINSAARLGKPYGLLGYSQGCANALMAETILLSGSPKQQDILLNPKSGLVCRQLLFSAANGSAHGPAMVSKILRLIVMTEDFFKYQQGYFSRAFASTVLDVVNSLFDSSMFQKLSGGADTFLPDGSRAFWREGQHCAHVPSCTLRGVLEDHTTPESLEMLSHLLTKQSGSPLHDSQVHVFDAVPYPVYYHNRNGTILKKCAIGVGAIQRTHHWSPLSDEVAFVRTPKDITMASFDCAKDRHVFPWVDVNVRFGFIQYENDANNNMATKTNDEP